MMRLALYLLLVLSTGPALAIDGAIAGRIEDSTTGTGLMGAYVLVAGTRLGTVADSSGYFTIRSVPPGTYRLTAKMLGYKAQIVRQVIVHSGQITSLDIAMQQQSIELETVTIVGHRRDPAPQQTSAHQIEARQVVEMPGGGEDLFRSLHALPGVVARADFASQFYVRGGSPDQNLIVVDRVPVFNPYRLKLLGGPVSMFNPDMVERVELLPGGFPAQYGDRLAAVLVVENREGERERRRWHPRLLVLLGMRLDYSTFAREWVLSPRLGLHYALTSDLTGRAGWGFYHQAPNFVGLFERFEREIEWNLFETIVLKTEQAQHFTSGLEWDRGQAHTAKLEGYYKRLDHLVVARDSTYQSIPDNSGRGHAYGLEVFLQRRPSTATRLSGWISYSLGVSKEGNPQDPLHYRDVDQRHTLDLIGRLRLTKRSSFDVRYSYGSGFPYTPVAVDSDGEPLFDAEGNVVWEETNSRRYSAYRRLDVRLSWRRSAVGGRTFTAYLEIINALNRRNVFEYYWDEDYRRLVSYMLPIMPFFGLRLGKLIDRIVAVAQITHIFTGAQPAALSCDFYFAFSYSWIDR